MNSQTKTQGYLQNPMFYLGFFGFFYSFFLSWNPSMWSDEIFTMQVSRLSFHELYNLNQTLDLVHSLYYTTIKLWVGLFGNNEITLRLFSSICVGFACSGVYKLAYELYNKSIAILSTIFYAILPAVTWMGGEARSTALIAALVIWATVALVKAVKDNKIKYWFSYSFLIVLSTIYNIDAIFILPAHGLTLLILTIVNSKEWKFSQIFDVRNYLGKWTCFATGSTLLTLPFIYFVQKQSGQINNWLTAMWNKDYILGNIFSQWFANRDFTFDHGFFSIAFAICGWVCILISSFFPKLHTGINKKYGLLGYLTSTTTIFIPLLVCLLISFLISPMYVVRYLMFTNFGPAIAIAVCVHSIKNLNIKSIVFVVLIALTIPFYLEQRSDYAKYKTDFKQIAQVVENNAQENDAILFYPEQGIWYSPRRAVDGYTEKFEKVYDPGKGIPGFPPYWGGPTLRGPQVNQDALNHNRIWVAVGYEEYPNDAKAADDWMQSTGYRIELKYNGPYDKVYLLTKQ